MMKKIITFFLVWTTFLSINNMNTCEAKFYSNNEHYFGFWIPDSFVYSGPPYANPSPNTVMEALDYSDRTNVNVSVAYNAKANGMGFRGQYLVSGKNYMVNDYKNSGITVLDDGIITYPSGHEAYYIKTRRYFNGINFDMWTVQMFAHNKLYTRTYTQRTGAGRDYDISSSMYSLKCMYCE